MGKTIYLVTGAAGFLGSHVCDELLERGERVRALVLPGDKSVKYVPKAVEIVEGNLCDVDSLETFFSIPEEDESIVIHCASMVTTNAEFNQKLIDVNVGGTRNMIDKCLEHPECRKMVYVSSTGAIPEQPKGSVIKETDIFMPIDEKNQVGCYSQSKAMATQEVLDACKSRGLKACVVHPSGILGPKDYAVSETTGTIIKIMNGEMTVGMGGSFNLCDVRDLAHGCVGAADRGRIGECYILGNKEVTLKEVCQMLHDASGCKMPYFYVPVKMAYLLAAQMEKKAKKTGQKPLMTHFAVYNLARNNQFDYSKAERELGYHTRPYVETLRDEAHWLAEEGYIAGMNRITPKEMDRERQTSEGQDGAAADILRGKKFIGAVAGASSREELKRILEERGVHGIDEETLTDSYNYLALSQNWGTVQDLFETKDFESCCDKLAAHGITVTREEFDLINEVIATGSDDVLIEEITKTRDVGSSLEVLHRHGYNTMTADFLLLIRDSMEHLCKELLTQEEIRELSGSGFYERCRKSINMIFALGTIAGLVMGVSNLTDPALLIAIAGGVSLMFGGEDHN